MREVSLFPMLHVCFQSVQQIEIRTEWSKGMNEDAIFIHVC